MDILKQFGITKESATKPITKAKSGGGRKVPLNEKLAQKYDEVAGVIKGSVGGDISGEDKKKISGFSTITTTYVKVTARVGGKIGTKLFDGVGGIGGDNWYTEDDMDKNKLEAVKYYTDLAAAIRAEQKNLIELVEAAREKNRAKKKG